LITRTRPAESYLATPKLPLRARLERFQRQRLFRDLLASRRQGSAESVESAAVLFALQQISEAKAKVERLRDRRRVFRELIGHATSTEDRRELILNAARELGSRGRKLRQDASALGRWMDETAIVERYERAIGEEQQRLTFLLTQVGTLAAERLSEAENSGAQSTLWDELDLEAKLTDLLEPEWDDRVRTAVLNAWCVAVAERVESDRHAGFSSKLRQRLTRFAQDRRQSIWIQVGALELLALVDREPLRIILQQKLATPASGDDLFVREHIVQMIGGLLRSWEELAPLVGLAVADPSPFVRQAVARQLRALPMDLAADYWLELAQDLAREVRGAAFDAIPHLVENHDLALWLGSCVGKVLPVEADPLVSRIGIESLWRSYSVLRSDSDLADEWARDAEGVLQKLQYDSPVIAVRRWAAAARERLWVERNPGAKTLLERLQRPGALPRPGKGRRLPREVVDGVDRETIGRTLAVLAQDDFPLEMEFGRLGARVTRGFRFRFRFWRFLHEVRNPAPDKRQGYRHTIGRVHYGSVRAPSERLSELAQTKVPGEPLYVPDEDGWRPFLPLLDDFLSTLNQPLPGEAIRFFTSQGVTSVRPPRTLAGRCRAWWQIAVGFPKIAKLRNWFADGGSRASAYIEELEAVGYEIEFRSHDEPVRSETPRVDEALPAVAPTPSITERQISEPSISANLARSRPSSSASDAPAAVASEPWVDTASTEPGTLGGTASPSSPSAAPTVAATALGTPIPPPVDDSVRRHFPALSLVVPTDLFREFVDYSLSLYENTLFDLALFVLVLGLIFLGRHAWANWTLHRARQQLGLVIGGWGTRGKSSVERLKAGLFNGLGHSLVSKTTGCEAMILYAPAFAEMRELFLFRPYDKATIWEQRNVTRISAGLGSDVMLWECMGLTPTYVDILQRQWMRDDLSTITNTYPDHEDLQGPAGINIPMVMTLFIPTVGRLLTSEEQMLPILEDAAEAKKTSSASVGWKEAALVPQDILSRFPYEEHPYNIALVSKLAEELGVSQAFAYKEMADRVVPDLGVLKTYPMATVRGRELEFSNGMSANERHGCLGNWTRLGLDRYDPRAAGRWTTTVVNNRADRIPRSKVFADIVVADLSADRHVLIGGNLDGLLGYLDEAWESWVEGVELWTESGDASPEERFESLVHRFRQPIDREALLARVEAMLGGAVEPGRAATLLEAGEVEAISRCLDEWGVAEELVKPIALHVVAEASALGDVERIRRAIGGGERESVTSELRSVLRAWFEQKIIVVDDYYATGDEIVDRIAHETPPGFRNHIIGIQNIKGTGLDFVYRWLAWERCHRSCRKVLTGDARTGAEGIEELATFREFGPLSEDLVRETLAAVRKNPRSVGGQLADLDSIETLLNSRVANRSNETGTSSRASFLQRAAVALVANVEDLLDAGDAIRRRKKADQIFRDLVDQRVSVSRAILLLQELTKRQKGGWLLKQLRASPALARVLR